MFLHLGPWRGAGLTAQATKPLPDGRFPHICTQVKKRAASKGKMLGGARSLGHGDTCLKELEE